MVKLLVRFPELGLTQETCVYETDPGRFNRKEDRPQCKRHLFMAWGPQLNKKKWPNSAYHPLLLDCSIASPSALTPWPPHLPTRVAWTLKQWGEVDLPYFLLLFVQLFAVAINKVTNRVSPWKLEDEKFLHREKLLHPDTMIQSRLNQKKLRFNG